MTTQAESNSELLVSKSRKRPGSGRNSESEFFNLNEYARARILFDMLQQKVLPNCRESPNYLIMVMDELAAKMISDFCSVFDLMEGGNVYQLEKLELKRKRYPMSDAVYLVYPSKDNIEAILGDYPEEDEIPYDQYGSVHLCFLT